MALYGRDPWYSDEPIRELGERDLPMWMRELAEAA
jgi:hypothetical protein